VEKFQPTLDQWKAVQTALGSRVSILTGGPGTGKSTICRVLCKTAAEIGLSVQLCAPTGKAAKRIAEVTNHQASTIHRMLEWQPFGGFARNSSNHLTCDVLVVDEASMIDLPLADALFQAVGDTTHVVLVGDIDQLPPVGIGRVLDDIIRSKRVPLTRLTEIFRQAKRSMIIQAAYAINGGRVPDDDPGRAQEKLEGDKIIQDYFWIPRNDNEEIAQLVVDYATERIPNRYGFDPLSEIQVLAPQKNTLVGVDALNRILQEKLNPYGLEISERKHFRVGDKLLNTRNNYTHDVMNGEFGFIKSWREADEMVEIELESRIVEMGKSDVEENFVLAYATTVHKMQGSASKAIVLPLSMSYYAMLSRNLLYTAVTRSEELCMIIGQPRALAYSVHEGSSLKRNSALAERLQHPLLSGQLV
jgi:exodeoxyribonuclease V alpha subunit